MSEVDQNVLTIRHVVHTSLEDAFDAWITPELVEDWWGPHGYKTKVLRLDAFAGGEFVFQMTGPSGTSCPMSGVYTKLERPGLLAFRLNEHCIADIPDHVNPPTGPSEVEVKFVAQGAKTEIVLTHTGLAADYQMLANGGWSQSLERMDATLA